MSGIEEGEGVTGELSLRAVTGVTGEPSLRAVTETFSISGSSPRELFTLLHSDIFFEQKKRKVVGRKTDLMGEKN